MGDAYFVITSMYPSIFPTCCVGLSVNNQQLNLGKAQDIQMLRDITLLPSHAILSNHQNQCVINLVISKNR